MRAWLIGLVLVSLAAVGCSGDDAADSAGMDAPVGDDGGGHAAEETSTGGAAGDVPVEGAALQEIVAARRIIRNAEIGLGVEDPAAAYDAIQRLVTSVGGFVSGADLSRPEGEEALRGLVVVRVPEDRLDAVLEQLESMALEVHRKAVTTEDVTDRVIDLDAQVHNLRLLEAELQELLADVRQDATPDQLFATFDRIRQVREQIETTEAQLRTLEQQVALSSVTITLEAVAGPASRNAAAPWHPRTVASEALAATEVLLRATANVGIWLGLFLIPLLLLVAAPVAAVLITRRWWERRRPPAPTPTPSP